MNKISSGNFDFVKDPKLKSVAEVRFASLPRLLHRALAWAVFFVFLWVVFCLWFLSAAGAVERTRPVAPENTRRPQNRLFQRVWELHL